MTAAPISAEEAAALIDALPRLPLALAVSGGADSMALLHLLAGRPGSGERSVGSDRPVLVLTVDHGLRPGSAADARFVADAAATLGLPCQVLHWRGDKPETGVQEAARRARYELFQEFLEAEWRSRGAGASKRALVTAHHADDQAETLLMRLARGSGVDGLAAMVADSTYRADSAAFGPGTAPLRVLRPLIAIAKDRLLSTLQAGGIAWRDDPSNSLARFERVRLREAWPTLNRLGLTTEALSMSARRLARAAAALDLATTTHLGRCELDLHGGAWCSLWLDLLGAAGEELSVRILSRAVSAFGGSAPRPRLSEIESLLSALQCWLGDAAHGRKAWTLGGTIVEARPRRGRPELRVFREVGREGLPEIELRPGEIELWDRRFEVSIDRSCSAGAVVRGLDSRTWSQLRCELPATVARRMPSRAALTLPAFWRGGRLIGVPELRPHLSETADSAAASSRFVGWPAAMAAPLQRSHQGYRR